MHSQARLLCLMCFIPILVIKWHFLKKLILMSISSLSVVKRIESKVSDIYTKFVSSCFPHKKFRNCKSNTLVCFEFSEINPVVTFELSEEFHTKPMGLACRHIFRARTILKLPLIESSLPKKMNQGLLYDAEGLAISTRNCCDRQWSKCFHGGLTYTTQAAGLFHGWRVTGNR